LAALVVISIGSVLAAAGMSRVGPDRSEWF
jgi:hypothetical protein